jgi:hypothetical protein
MCFLDIDFMSIRAATRSTGSRDKNIAKHGGIAAGNPASPTDFQVSRSKEDPAFGH